MSLFHKTPHPLTMSTLPMVPLVLIMDQVPLEELLTTVGQVCVRWHRVRVLSLARRRSITLLLGQDALECIELSPFNIPNLTELDLSRPMPYPITPELEFRSLHHSTVHVAGLLTHDLVGRFVELMPKISSLRVVGKNEEEGESELAQVTLMLNKWRSTLVTVKVWYKEGHVSGAQDSQLLSTVNSLPIVESLTLFLPDTQLSADRTNLEGQADELSQAALPQIDLPILARLKHFELASSEHSNCLVQSLTRHSVGCEIRLSMHDYFSSDKFPNYETVPQAVKSRITQINEVGWWKAILVDNEFGSKCQQFHALSCLTLKLKDTTTMSQLVHQLEPLGQTLIYLGVSFNSRQRFQNEVHLDQVGVVLQSEAPVAMLPSVRILVLSSETVNHQHTDLTPLRIAQVFPNLELAKVKDSRLYGFDCDRQCHSMFCPGKTEHCIRQQLQPFLHCSSLKVVYYGEKRYGRDDLLQPPRVVINPPVANLNLDRLSITELLNPNQDCVQSQDLQLAALKRRTEVSLLLGHPEYVMHRINNSPFVHNQAQIQQSSLSTRWLVQADITRLVTTFDNINTLRIFSVCDEECTEQTGLLKGLLADLANKLTCVTAIFAGGIAGSQLKEVLECFNVMVNLRQLSVEFPETCVLSEDDIENDDDYQPEDEPEDDFGTPVRHMKLRVLDRVSHFRFRSRDHPKKLFYSLQAYASINPRLVSICIWAESGLVWFEEPNYLTLPAELRAKITVLTDQDD